MVLFLVNSSGINSKLIQHAEFTAAINATSYTVYSHKDNVFHHISCVLPAIDMQISPCEILETIVDNDKHKMGNLKCFIDKKEGPLSLGYMGGS